MGSSRYKINPLVLIGVPTLEPRPLSWEWMDYFTALQFPLGASVARSRVHGQIVADARNEIVEQALAQNADYVLFISDDVLVPPNLFTLLHRHKTAMVTGVYWSKTYPTQPYLWNGMLKGPYVDWKLGEYFPVDWAGCDALLVETDVFRHIERPWFSHDWSFDEGEKPVKLATEDLYFYTKAKAAGYTLYCDTEAQCDHQDRATGVRFGLTAEMPQMRQEAPHPSSAPHILVADIGAGYSSPWFGANARVVRYDINEDCKPDIRCDVRAIPEKDGTYDLVSVRHVLEHFMPQEAPALVNEWQRILRPGGKLVVEVPNLAYAAREVLRAEADPNADVTMYPLWQFFGRQTGAFGEVHKNGFTVHGLRRLFELCGLQAIDVRLVGDKGESIEASGIRGPVKEPVAIAPVWREIEAATNGHREARELVDMALD